ncbi:hypothetical protein PG994_007147 [Apiospora phragmitis]|uniref:Uncharacterized protein n=1 Tax=Apiospora phragmitis TaxID=2905665 RepID=A0ABR1UZZ9_9PEZI
MTQQGTSNGAASSAPEGTNTAPSPSSSEVTSIPWTPSPANLGRLHALPPEIRVMIYQHVMDADDATPMVRTLVYDLAQRDLYVQSAHLASLLSPSRGLLAANPEALAEAARLGWVRLAARLVTFPGASVAHPDQGLLDQPLTSQAIIAGDGEDPLLFHPATTVFYTDQSSLTRLINAVAVGLAPAERFAWLTDLALDPHVLTAAARRVRPPPRPALPGAAGPAPSDRGDVVVLEGPYRDVVEEVSVVIHYASDNDNDNDGDGDGEPTIRYVQVDLGRFNPVFGLMITETVLHTHSSIRALNRAGVQVVWAAIWQGVTRRRDIQIGPPLQVSE